MKRGKEDRPPARLVHYTPLRYPGGKAKLARFVKDLIELNGLADGEYVEPYAGGAAIALELLFHEYVARVHINDVSRPVYAFWKSVLCHTDELIRLVRSTRLSVAAWDRQKRVLAKSDDHDDLELGFATFYLNRTNRSGILNGGIIGGRDQSGPWKIDARFNREELGNRIAAIAKLASRIRLTRKDALTFLRAGVMNWPAQTLVYLDPPYYVNGRQLYYDYYTDDDHRDVADFVTHHLAPQRWIVSYDNVAAIRGMYRTQRSLTYSLHYSARDSRSGTEVMFFSDGLNIPQPSGAIRAVRRA